MVHPLSRPLEWRAWLLRHYWNAPTPPTHAAVAAVAADLPLSLTAVCEGLPIYQLWTAESVAALARWIQDQGLRRVVEVGAGDGCLSRWLRPLLSGVTVVATDSGAWRTIHPLAPVERCDATLAPRQYDADAVLSSWMPYEVDWTPAWRRLSSVRAYVLVGEGPFGCVGREASWTRPHGWTVSDIPGFEDTAWCRTDDRTPAHSVAWGFLREEVSLCR